MKRSFNAPDDIESSLTYLCKKTHHNLSTVICDAIRYYRNRVMADKDYLSDFDFDDN